MIQDYVDGKLDSEGVNVVESMFEKGEENTVLKSILEKEWHDLVGKDIAGNKDMGRILRNVYDEINRRESLGNNGFVRRVKRRSRHEQNSCTFGKVYIKKRGFHIFIKKETLKVSKYTGWREGALIFRNDSLEAAVQCLKRWYNIDVEITDESIKQCSFRGTSNNDTIEDVFLSMTSPITCKIIPQHIDEEGNHVKQKVIISKNKPYLTYNKHINN